MSQEPRTNVVGTFDDAARAGAAAEALHDAGFDRRAIDVSALAPEAAPAAASAETGAGIGSLAGASVGALVGVGLVTGVLPAAGLLAATGAATMVLATAGGTVAGTALGAAVGGSEPSPAADPGGVIPQGRTVVTVAADGHSAEAAETLRRHGASDAQCVAR